MSQFKSDVEAVDALAAAYKELSAEIGKVIVGQEDVVKAVILSLLSNGHALLVGVPGLAKTLLVSTISEVLDLEFKRIHDREISFCTVRYRDTDYFIFFHSHLAHNWFQSFCKFLFLSFCLFEVLAESCVIDFDLRFCTRWTNDY
ncbi:MAG TPA: MoxR family ATPase, partial [Saprospiraceae bacterium]|nr:MoxR family ATPase [Saprospiraceae bacterium]